jgi:hypothetical protein
MLFLDNQWRRQRDGVAGDTDQQALLEGLLKCRESPSADFAGQGRQFDTGHHADAADVDDMR